MIVKINEQLFEITNLQGEKISDYNYYFRDLLKATSYIINKYKKELVLNTNKIINLYQNALYNANININIKKVSEDEKPILDLDKRWDW